MADSVLRAILTMDNRGFNQAVRRSGQEIRRLQGRSERLQGGLGSLKGMFAKAALSIGGLAAATKTLKVGFGEAADMESFRVQLETATKSAEIAGKKMSYAVQFANRTPFETGSIVEATARLEMMGMKAETWLPSIADMAGATSKSIEQAYEAAIDASVGEFERLKEFGLRKDDIMLESAKRFGKGVVFNAKGQMLDQQKMMTVLMDVMNKRYAGGAQKLSKTAKGLWSTVTGVTKTAMANIVGISEDGTIKQGSLFDKVKQAVGSVADRLVQWQKSGVFDKIGNLATKGLGKILETIKGVVNFLKPMLQNTERLRKIFEISLPVILGITAGLKAYTAIVKGYEIVTGLATVATGLLNGAIAISPFGWAALAIGGLVAAGVALYRNWDVVAKYAGKLWTKLKVVFSNIKTFGSDAIISLKNLFSGFINWFIDNINMMIDKINGISFKNPFTGETVGFNVEKIERMQTQKTSKELAAIRTSALQQGAQMKNQAAFGNNVSFGAGSIQINGTNMTTDEIANNLVEAVVRKIKNK